MKTYLKKRAAVLTAALLLLASPSAVFAGVIKEAQIPVHMTYTPAEEVIDVSVTDKITLTGSGERVNLDVSDIVIANHSTSAAVQVDAVEVSSTEEPWILTADAADFAGMEADLYRFSLVADGQDLLDGKLIPSDGEIAAGASKTIALEGKTGPLRSAVNNTRIATVVVTISEAETDTDYDSLAASGYIMEVVPTGGVYTAADGTVYSAGEEMPDVPADGDKLEYGDYSYQYNAYIQGTRFTVAPEVNGWNAKVLDRYQTSYAPIAHEIQGITVCSIEYCYGGCSEAVYIPGVPSWITRMTSAFEACSSLKGDFRIDANPVEYKYAFINTMESIRIIGDCSSELKAAIAATGNYKNVTWA